MTTYAYAAPDEWREDLVPDLRLEATQPWMGLTAFIADKPHLIIGKIADSFIMEDEEGNRMSVDFNFPWEEPTVETNRIVAASRIEKSPFKDAGLLAYIPDTGEWAVRVGISNMRYPLEERIAALEANNWRVSEFGNGNFDKNDVVVPVHGKCPNCGSDSLSYADDEDEMEGPAPLNDGVLSATQDPIVLCHACHQWSHESELKTGDDDAGGNTRNQDDVDDSKLDNAHDEEEDGKLSSFKLAGEAFSFQGKGYVSPHTSEGIAIMPEKQSKEEIASMLGSLPHPSEQMGEHVQQQNAEQGTSFPQFDNPFINRGGNVRTALQPTYPEEFRGGPFICVAKWLTPEMTVQFFDETPGGRGTDKRLNGFITALGGPGSHAFVVAQPLGVPVIVIPDGDALIDRIQPGDHLSINGTTGVVAVNGGDPNFVAQDPNSISVDNPIARFAYGGGTGHVEQMVPGQMVGDKGGHSGMMGMLMESGHGQVDPTTFDHNMTFGYICDSGAILQDSHPIPDEAHFAVWAHEQATQLGLPGNGPIKKIDVANYVPTGAHQAAVGDKLDEALKCPNCGSHTVEAWHMDEEKGKGEFGCLNCGNAFKADYRKHAGAELPKGTRIQITHPSKKGIKGSISDCSGTEENFGDHIYDILLDNGEELAKVPESHFNRIKSSSFDKTGVIIHTFLPNAGWHFSSSSASAEQGLNGTITYPDGTTLPLNSGKNLMMMAMKHKADYEAAGNFNTVPITVETDNPELFWQIWDQAGEGGVNRERHEAAADAQSIEAQLAATTDPMQAKHLAVQLAELTGEHWRDIINEWYAQKQQPSQPSGNGLWWDPYADLGNDYGRSASFYKGAPYPSDSYKNAPDHTPKDNKKSWPEEVNAIYNACMREGNGDKEKCAKIAWAKYDENGGHPKHTDKDSANHPQLPEDVLTGVDGGHWGSDYEGHPVMCYMCGNERTAALGSQCQHCGYPLLIRRDGPPSSKGWPKSAALEVGNWYSMHSPKYTVPDVIHVSDVSDDGITASIEGDDKGLFPIHLRHDEIETEQYSFEPYTPHVDKESNHFIETQKVGNDLVIQMMVQAYENVPTEKLAQDAQRTDLVGEAARIVLQQRQQNPGLRLARRDFTATEQKELVNENLSGRARNIHKLQLEGTHYPADIEASAEDILNADIYWW